MAAPGLVIAAPASGGGKTTITLALLRLLRQRGLRVGSCKVGPDYIDPAFHAAASGRPCLNLDPWAMRPEMLARLIDQAGREVELLLVEGVMGLFDGAADGTGSTADLAALAGWPVLLVVDAAGQGASAAALVQGFRDFRRDVEVAGVIFNRVGGPAHAAILARALAPLGVPILAALPRAPDLALPARHLGLVQAREHAELEPFLGRAAAWVGAQVDPAVLRRMARSSRIDVSSTPVAPIPPLGQRIAVAVDEAFAFAYPHLLDSWRVEGAEILPFSPLADRAPDNSADAVYLPGGYPELQAGRLASNRGFLEGLRVAADRGAAIYGECGGYMVLGKGLVDSAGARHPMAGLLPLESSFERPRLHLGYRQIRLAGDAPFGPKDATFRGHEFHYATILREAVEAPLFAVTDAVGKELPSTGARCGRVMGSFVHLIDCR
jgi:cobyrinic acid a,c-diamide synthase